MSALSTIVFISPGAAGYVESCKDLQHLELVCPAGISCTAGSQTVLPCLCFAGFSCLTSLTLHSEPLSYISDQLQHGADGSTPAAGELTHLRSLQKLSLGLHDDAARHLPPGPLLRALSGNKAFTQLELGCRPGTDRYAIGHGDDIIVGLLVVPQLRSLGLVNLSESDVEHVVSSLAGLPLNLQKLALYSTVRTYSYSHHCVTSN